MGCDAAGELPAAVFPTLQDEGLARFVAASTKQDLMRNGWTDTASEKGDA